MYAQRQEHIKCRVYQVDQCVCGRKAEACQAVPFVIID